MKKKDRRIIYSISSNLQKFFHLYENRTAFTQASRQTGRLNASIFTESGPVASAYHGLQKVMFV